MKKILAIILVLIMVLSLVGCAIDPLPIRERCNRRSFISK